MSKGMTLIQAENYSDIANLYFAQNYFYPLIGAVLTNEQKGLVFVDKAEKPVQVYVQHDFGFAQIFGNPVKSFQVSLEQYLFIEKSFQAPKVRLYLPEKKFLNFSVLKNAMWSERQRFALDKPPTYNFEVKLDGVTFPRVKRSDIFEIEKKFGVVSRFWRSVDDFLDKSFAIVAKDKNKIIGICYAAAVANRYAEIDIAILPEYQRNGIGKILVAHFSNECNLNSIIPMWDCFTNNIASMKLAHNSGFVKMRQAYSFLTIYR